MTFAPRVVGCTAVLALALALGPARADVLSQSASFTGLDPGDYVVQDGRFLGYRFSLGATSQVSGIGAGFGSNASGTIFGAIVPLSSPTANPAVSPANLASISLGDVVFAVPAGINDVVEPINLTLSPGSYAVVYGSGLFGASGAAGLSDGNTTIGTPSFFQSLFSPNWQPQDPQGLRVVVYGTSPSPVPEPTTLVLLATGLAFGALRLSVFRPGARPGKP